MHPPWCWNPHESGSLHFGVLTRAQKDAKRPRILIAVFLMNKDRDHLLWIPQLDTMRSPEDLVPFVGSYKPLTYLGVLFLMSIGMLLNSPL
jgi:hypothetical protein